MSFAVIGVGLGTAAITTGATMYANNQKKKATQQAMGQSRAAFGSVPEAAQYRPLDFNQEQLMAIFANQGAQDDIQRLIFGANKTIDADALRRAKTLIPNYRSAMNTYGAAGNDLLNGRLPFSDVLDIVSNRNELANTLGTPGTAGPATLKDLGLSKLDAIKAGGGILKDMVNIAETVSPIGRHLTPASMMISPTERINLGMQQNQLIQQSQQNANNLAAMGDPAAYAQMQLMLAQAGSNAAATQQYGNAAASVLSGLGGAYAASRPPSDGWGGFTGTVPGASPNYYSGRPAYFNGSVVPRPATTGYRVVDGTRIPV